MTFADNCKCYYCGKILGIMAGNVGRRDTCQHCHHDLRTCHNCKYFDRSAYNECKEPVAERVVDKDQANFCDYFSLGAIATSDEAADREKCLKALDDLFR
ncbi:MAG: hypothetical protein IT291_08870 [Deltaproteobacteria bacterium]|nr:hypothetical protein [Deltaproteobacteria bacterium]